MKCVDCEHYLPITNICKLLKGPSDPEDEFEVCGILEAKLQGPYTPKKQHNSKKYKKIKVVKDGIKS